MLHWYPNFLGGGAVTNAVIGLAVAQVRLGARVGVVAARSTGEPLYQPVYELPGVDIIEWSPQWTARCGRFLMRGIPRSLSSSVRKWAPNIVHIHGEFNPDNLWVPRLFTGPLVLSPHGAFHSPPPQMSMRRLKMLYMSVARRLLYARVAAFHALSPLEHEHIASVLPNSHIYCIPQGPALAVDQAAALPIADDDRRNGCPVRLLYVGRLDVFTKGLDILLQAYADASRELHPTRVITLTLVGPDWRGGMAQLKDQVQKLGISESVRFTGPVRSSSVKAFLTRSDVYIQLSRHDAFGLSVAEALGVGKPAILSDKIGITSFPEIEALPQVRIVTPTVSAATSAIIEVVTLLQETKSEAGTVRRAVPELLSWRDTAMQHIATYRCLCNGSDRAKVSDRSCAKTAARGSGSVDDELRQKSMRQASIGGIGAP